MGNMIMGASNGADMDTMVGTPDCPKGADWTPRGTLLMV